MSKVISPFRLEAQVKPGEDGSVHVDLIGEDGRTISQSVLDYSNYLNRRILISPMISFEIPGAAETARLVVSSLDRFGRVLTLSSVDIILLSVGDNEITLPLSLQEPYLIRRPWDSEEIYGGSVHLEALAARVNENPLIIQLLNEQGQIVGESRVLVPPPTGELSHIPFEVDIPYTISEQTHVILSIRQESNTRIGGTVSLTSIPLVLNP